MRDERPDHIVETVIVAQFNLASYLVHQRAHALHYAAAQALAEEPIYTDDFVAEAEVLDKELLECRARERVLYWQPRRSNAT